MTGSISTDVYNRSISVALFVPVLTGIAAGLWRSSARKYKEYALNPCCPACGRDLVDCLSEKMFARSKCKAKMEVGADG